MQLCFHQFRNKRKSCELLDSNQVQINLFWVLSAFRSRIGLSNLVLQSARKFLVIPAKVGNINEIILSYFEYTKFGFMSKTSTILE